MSACEPGTIATHDRDNIHVDYLGTGQIGCQWTPNVCDAMSRLRLAAAARCRPRMQGIANQIVTPGSVIIHIDARGKADRAAVIEAFTGALVGDPRPANDLARRWFDEWPADCGWRLDVDHDVWHAASTTEFTHVRDIWRRAREMNLHLRPQLRFKHAESAAYRLQRAGRLECLKDGTSRSWETFRAVGEPVPYDPLLIRRQQGDLVFDYNSGGGLYGG